jgi:hypothetical protein
VVDEDAAEQLEKSEYFEHYIDNKPLKGYKQAGYFLSEPEVRIKIGSQTLSDSQLIQILGSKHTKDEVKNSVLEKMFPKKDDKVFDMVKKKASLGAKKLDGFEFSDADGQDNKETGFDKTDAKGQDAKSPEVIGSKNTPIMQRKIRNPITGRAIKIQSALKYPRWKPVYKMANQVLKAAGIDRKDRTDDPEVNQRYRARQKKIKKEDITNALSQQLTEELLHIARTNGLPINLPGIGEVLVRLDTMREDFLVEGGAAGHLAHPYEDPDLKFSDLEQMIVRGLSGGLDQEAPVTEKLDGQNIQFSYRDGKIVFARNTGHVKNRGQNALDVDGVKDKFAGRGDLEASFGNAAEDLKAAVESLPPEQRQAMFKDGGKWVNLEIINPKTQNVIPYDKNILVFHNTVEYDENGKVVELGQDEGAALARQIQKVGAAKQKSYGIQGPQNIAFSDKADNEYKARQKSYLDELDSIRNSANLSNKSTLGDYFKKEWRDFIENELTSQGAKVSSETVSRLVNRWALGDKGLDAREFKKSHPELVNWFSEVDRDSPQINKNIRKPVEFLFLRAGADALVRMTNFMSANNPQISDAMKREVLGVIEKLKADPSKASELLSRELERLEAIGFDKIVPTEGVVFIYGGKPYKLTGSFAPINQLMGVFKFGKGTKPSGEPDEQPVQDGKKKPVVVYPGRFQPFHAGHYSVYKNLVDKYGADNVFIGTSNKTDNEKSPFNFDEKQAIMSSMFGIPKDKIVQVKNPYAPEEILTKFPQDTPFITAFSEKDADRLGRGGKYYRPLPDDPSQIQGDYRNVGYYTVAPEFQLDVDGQNISGTTVRQVLGDPKKSDAEKQKLFKAMYGKFDPKVYSMIVGKLSGNTPSVTSSEPSKKAPLKKVASTMSNKQLQSVLNKKVRNPETKRDILVKTALNYDKNHPARKAAMKMIQQTQSK